LFTIQNAFLESMYNLIPCVPIKTLLLSLTHYSSCAIRPEKVFAQ